MKTFKLFVLIITALAMMLSCTSGGGSAASSTEETRTIAYSWNFDDPAAGTAGWQMAEQSEWWDYKGTAALSYDNTTFGNGMLKLDVDFTRDTNSEWAEPKIKYTFSEPLEMNGARYFTYDIYFNPSFRKTGSFNSKIVVFKDSKLLAEISGNLISSRDEAENGYRKATVTLRIVRVPTIDSIVFSIAGYLTDYKGPVFFDNMRWD